MRDIRWRVFSLRNDFANRWLDSDSHWERIPICTLCECPRFKEWEIESNAMFSLKKKFRSKKSSSSHGSVSDLEDRVVMLCEDVPSEVSFDSGQGSISPGACSSGGSQSGDLEHGMEQILSTLDGFSYRKVFVSDSELPWGQPCYLLSQTAKQSYECFGFIRCIETRKQSNSAFAFVALAI